MVIAYWKVSAELPSKHVRRLLTVFDTPLFGASLRIQEHPYNDRWQAGTLLHSSIVSWYPHLDWSMLLEALTTSHTAANFNQFLILHRFLNITWCQLQLISMDMWLVILWLLWTYDWLLWTCDLASMDMWLVILWLPCCDHCWSERNNGILSAYRCNRLVPAYV